MLAFFCFIEDGCRGLTLTICTLSVSSHVCSRNGLSSTIPAAVILRIISLQCILVLECYSQAIYSSELIHYLCEGVFNLFMLCHINPVMFSHVSSSSSEQLHGGRLLTCSMQSSHYVLPTTQSLHVVQVTSPRWRHCFLLVLLRMLMQVRFHDHLLSRSSVSENAEVLTVMR